MTQPVTLGDELALLGLARIDRLDLGELERQQIKLALPGSGERLELLGLLLRGTHPRMGAGDLRAQCALARTAVLVEDLELGAGEHQLAVFVLAVEREEHAADFTK